MTVATAVHIVKSMDSVKNTVKAAMLTTCERRQDPPPPHLREPIIVCIAGELTASALALNFIGLTTTIRPSPPSHVTALDPFSRSISGLILTATLSALRSRGLLPFAERRDDSRSVLLTSMEERRVQERDTANEHRVATEARRGGRQNRSPENIRMAPLKDFLDDYIQVCVLQR